MDFFSNVVSLSSIMFFVALVQQGYSEGICVCGGPLDTFGTQWGGGGWKLFVVWSVVSGEV